MLSKLPQVIGVLSHTINTMNVFLVSLSGPGSIEESAETKYNK